MNIHTILDNYTINLSALFLQKSKFFRDSIESPTFSEHLQGINLQLPEINHDSSENPYDRIFNSIFPLDKMDIPANLIVIRAPFNRSTKEYMTR